MEDLMTEVINYLRKTSELNGGGFVSCNLRTLIFDFAEPIWQENNNLKKELEQWREEWNDQVIKANEEGFARTLQTIKIEKLEKQIKELQEENESLHKNLADYQSTIKQNAELKNIGHDLKKDPKFYKNNKWKVISWLASLKALNELKTFQNRNQKNEEDF